MSIERTVEIQVGPVARVRGHAEGADLEELLLPEAVLDEGPRLDHEAALATGPRDLDARLPQPDRAQEVLVSDLKQDSCISATGSFLVQ